MASKRSIFEEVNEETPRHVPEPPRTSVIDAAHQGARRAEASPRLGLPRTKTRQSERQADARTAPTHVVVQVAVVALEPLVDIRRERDEQQFDVGVVEVEP